MPSERILIVDTESKNIHLLRQILSTAGYAVLVANTGERAIQIVVEEAPGLVITEVPLQGDLNGIQMIKRMHEFSDVAVIILSSINSVDEILQGFEAGAVDYIHKPFDSRILLARIKVALRRHRGFTEISSEIICQDVVINLVSRQVTVNGMLVYLTETEYNLLLELARHPDQVLMHEQLLNAVWGPQYLQEVDYLRSFIHVLRRKLENNPAQPRLILNRPGIGYMLVTTPLNVSRN